MKRPMLLVWLAAASLMTALSGLAQELELGTALDNAHAKAVVSLAFSPNGEVLASGSDDMTIKLWNVAHHKNIATLSGHTGAVTQVAFSPDGMTIASASCDKSIKLWDAAARKNIATLNGHSGDVNSVAFSPDGKILASVSSDKTIKLWDVAASKNIATLTSRAGPISCLTFSPDGKTLAAATADAMFTLWNVATQKQRAVVKGDVDEDPLSSLAFSPDGRTLASGSGGDAIKFWDAVTGKRTATLKTNFFAVSCIAFSPDGKTLVGCSGGNSSIRVWDIREGRNVARANGGGTDVHALAYAPDGKVLVSGHELGAIYFWNVKAASETPQLQAIKLRCTLPSVVAPQFSPDGKALASIGNGEFGGWAIKLWNVATAKITATCELHRERLDLMAFNPDGKILASGGRNWLKLWDVATGKDIATLSREILLVRDEQHPGRGWLDQKTGQPVPPLDKIIEHVGTIAAVAISPDGKLLVSSGKDDETVKFWDVAKAKHIATLTNLHFGVVAIAFSKNGRRLYLASIRNRDPAYVGTEVLTPAPTVVFVTTLDVATRKKIGTFEARMDNGVDRAVLSHNGILVAGGYDNTIKVWDTTSKRKAAIKAYNADEFVYDLAISDDGGTLASVCDDVLKLWDVATGKNLATLKKYDSGIGSVALSPDGKILALGSTEGIDGTVEKNTIELWDIDKRQVSK